MSLWLLLNGLMSGMGPALAGSHYWLATRLVIGAGAARWISQ
ncbi:MAG: hypothetical protein ACKV19_25175 [Verrucomicrobiales bacterium]